MPRAETAAKVHKFVTQSLIETKVERFWRTNGGFKNGTVHFSKCF